MDLECAYLVEGSACGASAHVAFGLPICSEHHLALSADQKSRATRAISDYFSDQPDSPHVEGDTYVIEMPSGRVKIGFSAKGPLGLFNRWTSLSATHGAKVTPLAVIDGGWTLESVLHHRWEYLRLPDGMEEFSPAPELLSWAQRQGFTLNGSTAALQFTEWSVGTSKERHRKVLRP